MARATLSTLAVLLWCSAIFAQTSKLSAQADPCAAPEQKQLNFWLGEWDLTWPGEKEGEVAHGTNSVRRVMNGCVVQENFDGGNSMHLRGISLSTYVVRAGKWKQTWVDNEGGYLDFVGEFKDGQMVLARETVDPKGEKLLQRMVFKNISPSELDWSWESSHDEGKTWKILWPIHYKRKS
jgi:hypothetical protein